MCENSKQFFKSSGGRFTINAIVVETLVRCYYNHFHNISRLFDVLLNLSFTTSDAQLLLANMVYTSCLFSDQTT